MIGLIIMTVVGVVVVIGAFALPVFVCARLNREIKSQIEGERLKKWEKGCAPDWR